MATKTSKSAIPDGMISVLQRVSLKDMLIVGETADRIMADLTQYSQTDASTAQQLEATSRETLELAYGYAPDDSDDRKPFVYQDGVAVIPIHGTLINRFNGSWGFVTGYNYIRRMLNLALDDDDVTAIVFDVDSPGGEASGCFELAREIMASRRVKPSLAMVDSLAASGGMALAGAATSMYAIPSARIGSIGVYRMHVSYEGALKNEGIKITFATAGDHKVDGNPYQDLPQAVLDEWTESAGKTWDDFIALVAEARGMSEAEVRATQARVYRADEALAKGLINAVKTTTEAVAAWLSELGDDDPSDENGEEAMNDKTKGSEVASGLTAADMDAIKTLVTGIVGTAIGGVTRSQSIKDYGAAKGKGFAALAATLAADENISLEQAKTIIDASAGAVKTKPGKSKVADPADEDGEEEDGEDGEEDEEDADEESARARRKGNKVKGSRNGDSVNHLDNAMGKSKQPNVGAGEDGEDAEGLDDDAKAAAMILGDHSRVAGATSWSSPKK